MKKQITLLMFLLASSCLAAGPYVVGRSPTLGRYSKNTNGKMAKMLESQYTNCVLWMTMDKNEATQPDFSREANDGTVEGATWSSANGGIGSFDGTNDYINCGTDSSLDLTYITLSMWVNPQKLGFWNRLLWNTNVGYYYLQITSGNKFQFCIRNEANTGWLAVLSASTGSIGTWYHFVGTFDGTNMLCYINGLLEGSAVITETPFHSTPRVSIGKYATQFASALMDDVRIYNSANSSNEIYQTYLDTKATYGL